MAHGIALSTNLVIKVPRVHLISELLNSFLSNELPRLGYAWLVLYDQITVVRIAESLTLQ